MRKASVTGSQFYTYEAQTGRLTSVAYSNGIAPSYSDFDCASRPRTLTYTIGGIGAKVETVTYKAGGSLASLTLPGQDEVTYAYNPQKRLAQVASAGEVYAFTYDERGLATSLSYPSTASLALTYAWTLDGRPDTMELTATTSTDPLASLAYDYDAYGKVASIERADVQAAHQAAGTQSFTWDRLGRLAACDSSHAGSDEAYRYDARSNLEEKQRGDIENGQMNASVTTSFAHDDAGRIEKETKGASETLYHYDPAGRLTNMSGAKTAIYAYDGADRLTSASENGADVDYLYDSSGRMLSRTQADAQGTTHAAFLPAGASQEAGMVYGWEGEGTPQVSYSYVSDPAGTRLAQTDYATEGTGTTYPFRDPRGDVLDLASPSGTLADAYAYTPFGEMEPGFTAENTPFLYQDDYRDPATELYQMQARWYDPSTARFLSLDPKMGDASDPLRRLPYAYCANDPVYNSDPSGAFFGGLINRAVQTIMNAITGAQGSGSANAGQGGTGGSKRSGILNIFKMKIKSTIYSFVWSNGTSQGFQPRSNEEFSNEFNPAGVYFTDDEWAIINANKLFWRGNRLDPFFTLFGLKKSKDGGSGDYASYLASIFTLDQKRQEEFQKSIRDNYDSLPSKQKELVDLCYIRETNEIDIERFGVITEYYIYHEIIEVDKRYADATRGWNKWKPWNWRKAGDAVTERLVRNGTTWWSINRTMGTVNLRMLMRGAQALSYLTTESATSRYESPRLSRRLDCLRG